MAAFEVTFIDVGHGDATLIKTPDDRYILVDVRRCPGEGIDLFKFLDAVLPDGDDGRKRLDVLAITHGHDDHITGIGDLYDRYEVVELWWPQHAKKLVKAVGNYEEFERVEEEHRAAHEGEVDEYLKWPKGSRTPWTTFADGEVSVRCFSPPGFIDPEEELDDDEAKRVIHENCMVLKFSYKGCAIMLTGDSNKPCWERIVGYYEGRTDGDGTEVLQSQILHASHHGSRTFVKASKGDEADLKALELIDPEVVIISVGADSKHDHPHDDMVEVYEEQVGADNVLQTCVGGTVRLEVNEDGDVRLVDDDGDSYADQYGWDEDEEGDDSDDGDGGGGLRKAALVGGAVALGALAARAAAKSTPPSQPAPGHEKHKQQPLRRERYG